MQKCDKCGASWNYSNILEVCPFCGFPMEDKKTVDNILDAFNAIVSRYGAKVFLQGNQFIGLLADYAPDLIRERRLARIAMECGAYKAICNSGDLEKTVNKYITILTDSYFIDEDWAKTALSWCLISLGCSCPCIKIKEKNIDKGIAINGIKTKERIYNFQIKTEPTASSQKRTVGGSFSQEEVEALGNNFLLPQPNSFMESAFIFVQKKAPENNRLETIKLAVKKCKAEDLSKYQTHDSLIEFAVIIDRKGMEHSIPVVINEKDHIIHLNGSTYDQYKEYFHNTIRVKPFSIQKGSNSIEKSKMTTNGKLKTMIVQHYPGQSFPKKRSEKLLWKGTLRKDGLCQFTQINAAGSNNAKIVNLTIKKCKADDLHKFQTSESQNYYVVTIDNVGMEHYIPVLIDEKNKVMYIAESSYNQYEGYLQKNIKLLSF